MISKFLFLSLVNKINFLVFILEPVSARGSAVLLNEDQKISSI